MANLLTATVRCITEIKEGDMKAENKENAKIMCDAIRKFANNPEGLDNFQLYLEYHFEEWFEKYANSPYNLANEFKEFAKII